MRVFLFFNVLAVLLVNSAAEEFPNPCKRSDLRPTSEVNIRAAAEISNLRISSKFALLARRENNKREAASKDCKDDEMCYCALPRPLHLECSPVINGYNGYKTEQWEHNCENYMEYMKCLEKSKDYCGPERPWNWDIPCTWLRRRLHHC